MYKTILGKMFLLFMVEGILFAGCSNDEGTFPAGKKVNDEIYYANMFGKEVMEQFYYWNGEIESDLQTWNIETNEDPIGTVDRIKYHEGDKYIDKWTMLTDDMESFNANVGGVSTTFGWNLTIYLLNQESTQCIGVVNFVHRDTPAARAGLKRGDIIIGLNGTDLTTGNYLDLYHVPSLTVSLGRLDMENNIIVSQGKEVELTAVTTYEDPVLCDSVYEFGGKKVGYLAYSAFDLRSVDNLVEIGRHFKAEGVSELVLDLRYNGGGYVITENVLASVFAPQQAVSNQEIFERDDYNDYLTELYCKQGVSTDTRFTTEFNYPSNGVNVSTKDANIGLTKIYGLISRGSASASEALLGGLMPYMDVQLIGTSSSGKYCTGWMLGAEDVYENCPNEIRNWGIYLMVSIYKNAVGETPCMPDGLQPDVEVEDEPILPYALGDVNEPLLREALKQAGRPYDGEVVVPSTRIPSLRFRQMPPVLKPNFGKRIQFPLFK